MARRAFWSYVHQDDNADGGRISKLAHDVVEEYNMLTGENIEVFLDTDGIAWGDKWREEIDDQLDSVEFFVPVTTPRYFKSSECRRELNQFLQSVIETERKDLVLPLYYVDVPELSSKGVSEDDLIEQLRIFQWFDWRGNRFKKADSEEYRQGVHDLACELIRANQKLEEGSGAKSPPPASVITEPLEDEEPGILDRLADGEEAAGNLNLTITATGRGIEEIGEIMKETTAEIQASQNRPRGFVYRAQVVREMSEKLEGPIEAICELVPKYKSQLQAVDDGVRLMIELGPKELEDDSETKEQLCSYFDSVRDMSTASQGAVESFEYMIRTAGEIEKTSRDLRPGLRRLRSALTVLITNMQTTAQWPILIDESGVDCP